MKRLYNVHVEAICAEDIFIIASSAKEAMSLAKDSLEEMIKDGETSFSYEAALYPGSVVE